MRQNNIQMTSRVDKEILLRTLKSNLERHSTIVSEAKEGYILKAQKELAKRLQQIQDGNVVSLQFNLVLPTDYSEVYKTAIKMLEWTQEKTVELHADEFRQLVEDQWDWTHAFLFGNSAYSATAANLAGSIG